MPLHASCHCGAVRLDIDGELPSQLIRCTCSFCTKRGALHACYEPRQVRVHAPQGAHAVYRWNTRMVAHYFCRRCGVATLSNGPLLDSNGDWDGHARRVAVNARLLDGLDVEKIPVATEHGVPAGPFPSFT